MQPCHQSGGADIPGQLHQTVFEFHVKIRWKINMNWPSYCLPYFGGQIDWIIALEAVIERRADEIFG
jgi:hypothetical protein